MIASHRGEAVAVKRLGLVVVLTLGGCGPNIEADKAVLTRYYDQPIQVMTARLGYPQSEGILMGRKVYTWNSSAQLSSATPTVATGMVGNTPVSVMTYAAETTTVNCAFRVFVDNRNRIDGFDVHGQAGACSPYIRRLK